MTNLPDFPGTGGLPGTGDFSVLKPGHCQVSQAELVIQYLGEVWLQCPAFNLHLLSVGNEGTWRKISESELALS